MRPDQTKKTLNTKFYQDLVRNSVIFILTIFSILFLGDIISLFLYSFIEFFFFFAFYFFFKYHSFYLISLLLIYFFTFYHFGKICLHSEFVFFNFLVQATIIFDWGNCDDGIHRWCYGYWPGMLMNVLQWISRWFHLWEMTG